MDQTANYLPYEITGYFSKLVLDYLSGSETLTPFYQHKADLNGIKASIEAHKKFSTDRNLLVDVLQSQYEGLPLTEKVQQNISKLSQANTFTVTTAHQPNIFTGPLYFIYKIIHAIKLAEELKAAMPENDFVPVYYMGSEDADLDELGYVNVGGQKLIWETKQTGAVGRMKVDKALLKLISAIYGQTGVLPFGNELNELFIKCYSEGKTIQQATLELVNELFGSFGLIVVIPDNATLKSAFRNVVEKELQEGFSHNAVKQTISELEKQYKVQTEGRDINLFYLINDKRERIEKEGVSFTVKSLGLTLTKEEILKELSDHPENFSANVILRGAFQETILPNIAFIGGGGELAYWIELKKVFEAAQIPYPVLILRNSFLLMKKEQSEKWLETGFGDQELFKDALSLINDLVRRESDNQLSLSSEIDEAHNYYASIKKIAEAVDPTLSGHINALEIKAVSRIEELQKKLLRAERSKYAVQQERIQKIKTALFPNDSLQERVENFSLYYAKYGKDWLKMIYEVSTGFNSGFGIVVQQ